MSSEIGADIANVNGALRFKRLGSPTPVDIPANGVLVVRINDGASITLGGGGSTSLVGIKYIDEDGVQIVLDDDRVEAKLFRAATGVTITVMHNQTVDLADPPVAISPEQRILTSSGKNFPLEVINTQVAFAYAVPVAGFRWGFTDRHAYTSTPGHFADPQPNTPEAITRMAAALSGLLAGPIP